MPNRLAAETSPYLLQHADNPVDWWPWGAAAFAEAAARDLPLLLSVGYAACHWCHVMAHESFEDPAVAALMNANFVNIKVDREERPDVDAVYMSAAQALTGHGGWPMTVFLTQDGKPFYAGTYFPPLPMHGLPSFAQVLKSLAASWQEQRPDVDAAADRIAAALQGRRAAGVSELAPDRSGSGSSMLGLAEPGKAAAESIAAQRLSAAVVALSQEEDAQYGGFGGAPKFPPSMTLEFLLRHAAAGRLQGDDSGSGRLALELAGRTLTAMARSGMYDQVAGGFARYAVDRQWVVPHFEKMLYDNALLARVYLHWWRLTGEPTGARLAEEICDWMLAELGTAQGALASSLDADTPVRGADGRVHGVEGFSYVWSRAQLLDLLGPDDGRWAAELLRVTPKGTFEHGTSTLQLDRDVWADPAQALRWQAVRAKLHAARVGRPQPAVDDKVLAAWNGLAVAALAETGALLERPDLIAAAERIADLLLTVHLVAEPGTPRVRLRRVSRNGVVGAPGGVLEDYGDVAEGLLTLHCVTGEPAWLQVSGDLLDTVLDQFSGDGIFYDTASDAPDPALSAVGRPSDPTDNAYPSGWSAAAGALLSYAALTGSSRHRIAAESGLARLGEAASRTPRFFSWTLAVAQAALDGPREVAVVGRPGAGSTALHRVALAGTAPGLVIGVGPPGADLPLLSDRPMIDEQATAYVCRGFVCRLPTTSARDLAQQVGAVGAFE